MFRTSKGNTLRNLAVALVVALALGVGFVAGSTVSAEPQPQMRAALVSLRAAKGHLDKALADKGGHREAALKYVDEAIDQVQAGIAYDNRH